VASRDMTPRSKSHTSRSQRHVTYPSKNCNNSVLGGRVFEANMTTTPQRVGTKWLPCNAGCLATRH